MATISQFKANMVQGGFRPNQFKILLTFPSIISGGSLAGQKVEFMGKSASLPASTLESITTSYRGRQVKFAGERSFQPWTIDVYTDTDFSVRNSFESWVNTIQRPSTTGGAIRPAVYQTDLKIVAMDRNDQEVKSYIMHDAYPIDVSAINLDWEVNNQIGQFTVTFDYNWFDSDTGKESIVV